MIQLRTSAKSEQSEREDDILNPYLVGLGVILLQLSEGKSLLQWVDERDDISGLQDEIEEKASAAWTWLTEDAKLKLGGPGFGKIIKQCLQCTFPSIRPQENKTLSDDDFRGMVYHNVVDELEKIYNIFTNPLGD
jgi:hypothetical protein